MEFTGIKDKIVLITGASGGIGSAAAEQFAKIGAKLSLTGRDESKLQATAEACKAAGTQDVFTVVGDITDAASVKNIVDSTVAKYGGIDILINCAGIIRPGVFLTTTMENYDAIYKTNLRGTFSMCKEATPHIVERKGSILNISSFTGIRPAYAYFAYAMAEAALDQFTRALALELGPKGVRVNSVNPGVVKDSAFWTREGAPMAKHTPEQMEKLQEGIKKMYPMKRIAEKKDVSSAIVFLCSEQASFIHGVVLPVDGGKVLTAKGATDDKPQS